MDVLPGNEFSVRAKYRPADASQSVRHRGFLLAQQGSWRHEVSLAVALFSSSADSCPRPFRRCQMAATGRSVKRSRLSAFQKACRSSARCSLSLSATEVSCTRRSPFKGPTRLLLLHLRHLPGTAEESIRRAPPQPGPESPDARLRLRFMERSRSVFRAHARSKRSRFITLPQAAAKSRTNTCCESPHA